MKINNRKIVITTCLIWLTLLLLFIIFHFFFFPFKFKKYKWVFSFISIALGAIACFKIWNAKYLDMYITSNQVIIKQFYVFRYSKTPLKYMDIPAVYLKDFIVDCRKKQLIFKIKSRTKSTEVQFPLSHLRSKEITGMESKIKSFIDDYKNMGVA